MTGIWASPHLLNFASYANTLLASSSPWYFNCDQKFVPNFSQSSVSERQTALEKVEGRSHHFCSVLASSCEFRVGVQLYVPPSWAGEDKPPISGHVKLHSNPLFSCSFTFCFKLVSFGELWRLVEGGGDTVLLQGVIKLTGPSSWIVQASEVPSFPFNKTDLVYVCLWKYSSHSMYTHQCFILRRWKHILQMFSQPRQLKRGKTA